jgi:hypothetical protein
MLSKKFLHISKSSIAQQQLFKTQDGLMLPSLNKRVKERRGFQNAAAARSQIDPRVGKMRRRRYLVGWKKFFFQVWEQKKKKQQQDLRTSGLQPKGSEANFSLPSLLLQQGRNNTSLHLQIEKNGRRDTRILSFASEQQRKQQKQQRQWLALHEFQVPPRRSQAAGRKGCSSFRVLAGVWLRAARRGGSEDLCAGGRRRTTRTRRRTRVQRVFW